MSPYLDQCALARVPGQSDVPLAPIPLASSYAASMSALGQIVDATRGLELRFDPQRFDHSTPMDQAHIGAVLRFLKAQFDIHAHSAETASVDAELADFLAIGRARSDFAKHSIQAALLEAWQWAKSKNLLLKNASHSPTGLFILGLGKLGGGDLNFSSDVDLVAFFDRDTLPVNPSAGRSEAAGKILARLGRTLSDPLLDGAEGRFVWRVDWRLRPDPSVNPLAISSSAGLDYYFFHADPWERLAFAKAQVAAGDSAKGALFLRELEPFIWRRNLDFQALDDIAALKNTIHARHPGLASERERHWVDRGATLSDWAGYNLKLGVGGIREIEFLTQALQMLWGGRDTSLRAINCPTALIALKAAKILDADDADGLLSAYCFLRRAENALQAFQNAQTQVLPQSAPALDFIVASSRYASHSHFLDALKHHTAQVAQAFDDLLVERHETSHQPGASTSALGVNDTAPADFLDGLDERATQVWAQLVQGKVPAASSAAGRGWLDQLLPWIASVASRSSTPSDTLVQLHQFLARQPLSASYLETMVHYPNVRNSLERAFVHAPALLTLVRQSPFMIDRLIAGEPGDLRQMFEAQRNSARDDEIWLERLRRIVNEELFAAYAAVLDGTLTPGQAEERLSHLAIEAIRSQVAFVANNRKLPVDQALNRINVIAMGKLGMGCMAPLSDLDLIFVNSDSQALPDLRAFMSRFISGMTTKMREGIAYELDLRLRPNGRSGPPAITLAAFDNHHNTSAKTWEHLALSAGRVLTLGSDPMWAQQLEHRRQAILRRPRDSDQLRMDAARMLVRLRKHRITAHEHEHEHNPNAQRFNIKLRPGGLMEAEYLIATLTVLKGTQDGGNKDDIVGCAHDDRMQKLGMHTIGKALRFWRDAQWFSRLMDLGPEKPPTMMQTQLFCQRMSVETLTHFDQQAAQHAGAVSNAIHELLPEAEFSDDSAQWAGYREEPVRWR